MKNTFIIFLLSLFFFGLLAGIACPDDDLQPAPVPVPDPISNRIVIHLPELPAPEPVPTDPDAVPVLPLDRVLVIESDVEMFILQIPADVVDIFPGGPREIVDRFADGGGKRESRKFAKAFVYEIFPDEKTGQVELIMIPSGVTDKDAIVRQLLQIGAGPQPPPIPVPPGPTPIPVPPQPTAQHLSIAVVEDVLRITPDAAILFASRQWQSLPDQGHEYRRYDKTTSEPGGLQAIQDAGSMPLPVMVVRDKDSRLILKTVPLPKDVAELESLIKSLTGG